MSNLYGERYRITAGGKMTAIYRAIIHSLKKFTFAKYILENFAFFFKKWAFSGCSGGAMGGHFGPEHAPRPHCDDGEQKL